MLHASINAEMDDLEARKAELTDKLPAAGEPVPLLHPRLADLHREKVEALAQALSQDDTRAEAANLLRSPIRSIELIPENGKLTIHLGAGRPADPDPQHVHSAGTAAAGGVRRRPLVDRARHPASGVPSAATRHVTRLDFDSIECRFTIPALDPVERPTPADALVPLTTRSGPGAMRALFGLDRAKLSVLRPDDLLSLAFRFSGLLLELPRLDTGQPGRVLPSRGAPVCRGIDAGRSTRDERPISVA